MSPKKYEISKMTLFMDKFMSRFITIGGLSVILAVLLILVFIGKEVVPLLQEAKVSKIETISIPKVKPKAIVVDEWTTLPGLVTSDSVFFIDFEEGNKVIREEFKRDNDSQITAVSYNQEKQAISVGNAEGKFSIIKLNYKKKFLDAYENGRQLSKTIYDLEQLPYMSLSDKPGKIIDIQYAETDEMRLVAAVVEVDSKKHVFYVTLEQEMDLFGNTSGELKVGKVVDLTENIQGDIKHLVLSSQADSLLVSSDNGKVYSFRTAGGSISFNQAFEPFANESNNEIASMDFIFGSKNNAKFR